MIKYINLLGFRIVRVGFIRAFVLLAIGVALCVAPLLATKIPGAIAIFLSLFTVWFFRHPKRDFDRDDNSTIIAPADGVIVQIDEVDDEYIGKSKHIGIFMSPMNVHVNRTSVKGKIEKIDYRPGKFIPASDKDAPIENEQQHFLIASKMGKFRIVQISGILARRIVKYSEEGQKVDRGDVIGMIMFGSRVDLYMPIDAEITCNIGDKPKAGETVLARM